MDKDPNCPQEIIDLDEFIILFPKDLPSQFPPSQGIEHAIDLIPNTLPITKASYCLDFQELQELKQQLKDLLKGVSILHCTKIGNNEYIQVHDVGTSN